MTITTSFNLIKHKSYGKIGAGFPAILPINVIIGKNNIGKSALLDALDFLCDVKSHRNSPIAQSVIIKETLSAEELRGIFPESNSSGQLKGNWWHHHGVHLNGSVLTWRLIEDSPHQRAVIEVVPPVGQTMTDERLSHIQHACRAKTPKTHGKRHVRLAADRDIVPEPDDQADLSLSSDGTGATRIIQQYIHHATHDRELVQTKLLTALNSIFYPDIVFNEIITRFLPGINKWEIFLGEEGKGVIPLSASGSGLKTVILTLLNLFLRPVIENKSIESYIFSFEELENNLHPSLQRNLFAFLEDFATNQNTHIFLTSHSNVAIDMFSDSKNAQILHVRRGDSGVYGVNYSSIVHGHSALDDLGARASDLLQANGIIWVEGPSDRVYLNKWIELYGGGVYREGHHYQFVFYGGSVLAHISASTDEEEARDAINALKINRNYIFVCDSDRKSAGRTIKPRVARLLLETKDKSGFVWVTNSREIENYIPVESFETVHDKQGLPQIGEYEGIQDYLKLHRISRASDYTDKHTKALKYAQYFTVENLRFRPELESVMETIIDRIMKWNA